MQNVDAGDDELFERHGKFLVHDEASNTYAWSVKAMRSPSDMVALTDAAELTNMDLVRRYYFMRKDNNYCTYWTYLCHNDKSGAAYMDGHAACEQPGKLAESGVTCMLNSVGIKKTFEQ